jgi:hypothetical protein
VTHNLSEGKTHEPRPYLRGSVRRASGFVLTSKPEIEVQPSPTVPLRPHNSASNVKSPAITHNHGAPKEGEHHAGSLFQTPITYQGIAQ